MTKNELKQLLTEQIQKCEDIYVLNALKAILDEQPDAQAVHEPDASVAYGKRGEDISLTEDQLEYIKSALEQSEEDVRMGRVISHEDVKTYYKVKALLEEE